MADPLKAKLTPSAYQKLILAGGSASTNSDAYSRSRTGSRAGKRFSSTPTTQDGVSGTLHVYEDGRKVFRPGSISTKKGIKNYDLLKSFIGGSQTGTGKNAQGKSFKRITTAGGKGYHQYASGKTVRDDT